MKNKWLIAAILLGSIKIQAQTLSETQMRNARATGYAIVAARNPGVNFSVLMIPWDGVNTLEYNAQHQINSVWHAQAAVKGNFFNQAFDGDDFSSYSSVLLSQADFDQYKHLGTQWWIVCSVLPPFSNSISSNGGNIGIGTVSPTSNLHIYSNRSIATIEATGDHASLDLRAAGNNGGGAPSVYFKRGSVNYGAIFVERGTGGGNQPMFSGTDNTDFVVGTTAEVPIKFGINGQAKMTLSANGKLGVGSLSPLTALHVDGKVSGGEAASNTGTPNGIMSFSTYGTGVMASMGIEANVPAQYFWLQPRYINQAIFYNTVLNPNGGSVGIGTTIPSEKLSVNGNVRAKKVIVSQTGWPDYVFAPAYKLRPLNELAAFIQKNQHLPDMPSAKEVEEKGISVGDNQALLLKKIEELTLYILQQENRIRLLEKKLGNK